LTSGLHASFDRGSWALVPLDHRYLDELDKFFDKKGNWRKGPRDDTRMKRFYNGAKSFQYTLLALPHDDGMSNPLFRSWTTPTSASELAPHFFPYDTLPVIHSHIQPHFVVYNLGTKLCGLDWLNVFLFDDRYRPLKSQHPTLFTCIQWSMNLYREWTREQPPSSFIDWHSRSGDQMGVADVHSAHNLRDASSRKAPKTGDQGRQIAGQSSGGDDGSGGMVDDEVAIYPDDSLTLVFEAAAEQDDTNEPPNDEHTDDESDDSFYARLNTWVRSIQPGDPSPPSPATLPAYSHPGSKTTEHDIDSEDGSTTFVGIMDQTCLEGSVALGEKVGMLYSFSLVTPDTN